MDGLVVALQAAAQIGEALPQVEKLLEGLDLAGDVFRLEVIHALESEIDLEVRCVRFVAQFVFDGEGEMGFHAFEDGIEVVGIDLDELAFFQLG